MSTYFIGVATGVGAVVFWRLFWRWLMELDRRRWEKQMRRAFTPRSGA